MKIIYLHQYFVTPKMTGGTRSYEMARRLVAMGHDVHVVTSDLTGSSSGAWFESQDAGLTVHWLPNPYSNKMSYGARIKAFLRFAICAATKAASLRGDLVFATSAPLTIALPAIYASRRNRIPMVFEVRDLWPETPIAVGVLTNPVARWCARLLETFAYRASKAVVALSPGMRDGVVRTGYQKERIAVIPNAADNEMFCVADEVGRAFRARRAWLGQRPLLVYAGAFGKVNGVGYSVSLASEIHKLDPEIRILLVGDGAEYEMVKEQAVASGVLGVNLFMERTIPKLDVPALLNAADMAASFVIDVPALHANSANKFFDALAAGRPVLINHGGWLGDLIREHDCGLVTYKDSIAQAAMRVVAALQDHEWRRRSGEAARKLAQQQFDRDMLAAQLGVVLLEAGKPSARISDITVNYYG